MPDHVFFAEIGHVRRAVKCFSTECRDLRNSRESYPHRSRAVRVFYKMDRHSR